MCVCFARQRGSYFWEGSSSSHDPFFSREAASSTSLGRDRQALGVPNFSCEAAFLRALLRAALAKKCLPVIPRLPCLKFGSGQRLPCYALTHRRSACELQCCSGADYGIFSRAFLVAFWVMASTAL